MRILIVDNNVELCQVLQEYLNNQQDLEVVDLAHDGEQALIAIQSLEPDIVLLDITMPFLDGLGVLERLKNLNFAKKPRIIVITAFSNDSLLSRLTAFGVDYFILKPFRLEILADRIRQFSTEEESLTDFENFLPSKSGKSKEHIVTRLLHKMGVPPHYKGFSYLREAVLMCGGEGYLGGGLTKEMYPALAEKYKTTSGGVEAAIRNAVISAWEHGNKEYIKNLCDPYCTEKTPTNSLIIAKIAEESQVYK
ncbi:MAG: sporulation transcription factor Spo0A [Firmicutes bacterium]|nr:sporulation transcription factor Spo0A [Bacillota bacterium]